MSTILHFFFQVFDAFWWWYLFFELLLVKVWIDGISFVCFCQILYQLKQNSECEGKKLEESTAKLKDQKLLLEKELSDQQKKLEQAIAKVRLTEENNRKLENEASQFAALEETIRKYSKTYCTNKSLGEWRVNQSLDWLLTVILICWKNWIFKTNWFSVPSHLIPMFFQTVFSRKMFENTLIYFKHIRYLHFC